MAYYLTMLYERWRAVAHEYRNELALWEVASGRRWTFAELAAATESAGAVAGGIAYPQENSAEFLLAMLRAWRAGAVVCPLEPGQTPPSVPQPPAHCVHLKTTSASTGAPRVIAFTAAQLAADADNIVATMGLRRDWPNLGVISLAHSYGFSNLVLPLLLDGIPLILVRVPLPEIVQRAAALVPALTLAGVPALWRAWHDAQAIPPNVRLAISAGAPLTAGLEQSVFAATGLKIHNFYGASECGGIAYDATDKPRESDACVGTAMKNVSLSVADSGCLEVRSRAVGETYWPEADEALQGGRFRAGDLAEIRDGAVYLRGRTGDQINVAGRKISPETIERALGAHAGVRECLVFGVPTNEGDRAERIVACVVAKPGVTGKALRQFLLDKLPAWQVPRDWWFVDELRVNQRGKISRAEWRGRFLAEGKGPIGK